MAAFAGSEGEAHAAARSQALRAHTFGQHNLTRFMKGSKVPEQGAMAQGNGQSPSEPCEIPELGHCRTAILPG